MIDSGRFPRIGFKSRFAVLSATSSQQKKTSPQGPLFGQVNPLFVTKGSRISSTKMASACVRPFVVKEASKDIDLNLCWLSGVSFAYFPLSFQGRGTRIANMSPSDGKAFGPPEIEPRKLEIAFGLSKTMVKKASKLENHPKIG